jgi:hypothetical protein
MLNGYGRSIGVGLGFNRLNNATTEISAVEGANGDGQGDSNLTAPGSRTEQRVEELNKLIGE